MLSKTKNFLFIHVPKTAGNSIQDALRGFSDDKLVVLAPHHDGFDRFEIKSDRYNTTKHSTLSEYDREYGRQMMDSLYKFACVRNPWDRCMSHYFSPSRGRRSWNKEDFLAFVGTVVQPVPYFFSRSGNRQTIESACENLDFIIRHETLEDDFRTLCQRIGLPETGLVRRNMSGVDLRRHYDTECVRVVERRFAEEIQFFGYFFQSKRSI